MAGAGSGWRLYDVLRVVAMGSLEWQVSSFVVDVDGSLCCAGAHTVLVEDGNPGHDVCVASSIDTASYDERHASLDIKEWVGGYAFEDAAGPDVFS